MEQLEDEMLAIIIETAPRLRDAGNRQGH